MRKRSLLVLVTLLALVLACRKDREEIPDPPADPTAVSFNLQEAPYAVLSSYRFFTGPLAELEPNAGVLPYDVITPLFSDYAHKKRFVWMPSGTSAHYVDDRTALDFPDGAVLIKNFYYEHVVPGDGQRIVETRLLYRKAGHWRFANYIWNEEQTEAVLNPSALNVPVTWMDNGTPRTVNYRIPSEAECLTCHKNEAVPIPIGPKPQSMNMDYAYSDGVMEQLAKWAQVGYLTGGYPATVDRVAKWDDPTEDMTRRVRAYLDMNCAHCHDDGRHCDYRPMRFAWSRTVDLQNIGVCVAPDDPLPNNPELVYIVAAGNTNRSMLLHRLSTNDESERMPLLGRTVVHEEAVALIHDWIQALSPPCN